MKHPVTPDGRYFVVDGRLWRMTDPSLDEETRDELVRTLMQLRRAIRDAEDEEAERKARAELHETKVALGERGPTWWDDDAPDYNRKQVRNTPYEDWYDAL